MLGGTDGLVDFISQHELNVSSLMETITSRFDDDWSNERLNSDPRLFASDGLQPGVKMCRHARWMGKEKHLKGYIPRKLQTSLMRFRLCVWDIEVNRPGGRDRADRWCRVCMDRSAVEDEKHVLLECPEYAVEREGLWALGISPSSETAMAKVMGVEDQRALARVVHAIRCRRLNKLGSLA